MIPCYVVEGNYAVGSPEQVKNRRELFSKNLADPRIAGAMISSKWDKGDCLRGALAITNGKPWLWSFSPQPIPAGVPTIKLNDIECGQYWTEEYFAAACAWVENELAWAFSETTVAPVGLRVAYAIPYPTDNEDGLFASPPHGGAGGNYAAEFAAAGYTPDLAIAFHLRFFHYVAGLLALYDWRPVMTIALLTPGNEPRVDNSGQVTDTSGDFYLSNGIIAAFKQAFTDYRCAVCYDVFDGSPLPPIWAQYAQTLGGLVIQPRTDGKTQWDAAKMASALAAAEALGARWFEPHAGEVDLLPSV
jgi:hypothetical protein